MIHIIISILIWVAWADPEPTGGAYCITSANCSHGFCQTFVYNNTITNECICGDIYAGPRCSYERQERAMVAFLQITASIVFIYGVGNFILGFWHRAVSQLIIGLIFYIIIVPIRLTSYTKISNHPLINIQLLLCGVILGGFIWSVTDGILISVGDINDSNGYSLY